MNFKLMVFAVFATLFGYSSQIVPHVTRTGGGFSTMIQIENDLVTEASYTLTPYNETGAALTTVQGVVMGGGSMIQASAALFGDEAVSHFEISADEGVRISVLYDYELGQGSPAHVGADSETASIWRIFPGNWDQVFDGLAVVNSGTVATDVWIAQKDMDGNVLTTVRINDALAPNAKMLYVIGSPDGSPFSRDTPGYFEISANQMLAVTALRGTLGRGDTGFLWANDKKVLSKSSTTRDDKGVWFIEGGTLYHGLEQMGYQVMVDRLYQNFLGKLASSGRNTEILGPTRLNGDVITRAVSYSDADLQTAFDNLDSESQILIKAYADGINRRVAQVNATPELMPWEFTAINIDQVEYWTIYDVMRRMVQIHRVFSPDPFGLTQLDNGSLLQDMIAAFGEDRAMEIFNDLLWVNDPDAPTMTGGTASSKAQGDRPAPPRLLPGAPDMREANRFLQDTLREQQEEMIRIGAFLKAGSYGWVVHGSKTASGNPILHAGPQMGFNGPPVVLEGSLKLDDLELSGMTVAGYPGILVGRNSNLAWGLMVGHAHNVDLFIEPVSEARVDREEVFNTNLGTSFTQTIRKTDKGPVVLQLSDTQVLSWKSSSWGADWSLGKSLLVMARATNKEEFAAGVRELTATQHVIYADKNGDIAYWMSGKDPVRPVEGDYRLPQGAVTNLDYDASVLKPMPHVANPASGFIGGWNNKAAPDYGNTGGFYGFHSYGPIHRSRVITDYLASHDNLTFDEVRDLAIRISATDSLHEGGNLWLDLAEPFKAAVAADPTDARNEAIAMLDAWDGQFIDGGQAAWLFGEDRADASVFLDTWIQEILNMTFSDELGRFLNLTGFRSGVQTFNMFLHTLDGSSLTNSIDYFENRFAPDGPQTRDATIVAALDSALSALGEKPWGVGTRGVIAYPYTVGALDGVLDVGSSPFLNRATYTHVIEIGPNGPVRLESHFPLGQSGHVSGPPEAPVLDPNGTSMKVLFDNFQTRPFPMFQD